ncbi:MAG: hypothetical protein RJA12_1214, partial [Planctomycetota bacterium]
MPTSIYVKMLILLTINNLRKLHVKALQHTSIADKS